MFKILIVPSAKMHHTTDGRLVPGSETLRRLETMRDHELKFDCIVFTGGSINCSKTPDAIAMYDWALLNLPAKSYCKLVVEERAADTFENARYSLELLRGSERLPREADWEVWVATDTPHYWRFVQTFRAHGVKVKHLACAYPISWRRRLEEVGMWLVHVRDPLGQGKVAIRNRTQRLAPASCTH